MIDMNLSSAIRYAGVDDTKIDLFESQYPVPRGVSYNSFVILDEKTAVLDTADHRMCGQWLENVERILEGRELDYLVLHHLEPDHAGSVGALLERHPGVTVVASAKAAQMLPRLYPGCAGAVCSVKEGDVLSLGHHSLRFVLAPMVHWPEVMVSYEASEKILFSADAFGTFGAVAAGDPWLAEARRYYFNIVGKYGAQVQALLKKTDGLELQAIAPLHGPVLRGEEIPAGVERYDLWSRYEPEEKDAVLVAWASIHGNTAQAAELLAELLREKGCREVVLADLSRCDQSRAVEDAFRCGKMACLSATYDGGLFPPMEHFLAHLRDKTWRGRRVALVENGCWAPAALRHMRTFFEGVKDVTVCETCHSLQGAVKPCDREALEKIAEELLAQ